MRLAAFNGPSPKIPYRCKNLADISYTDRVVAFLSKISLPWQWGGRSGKMQLAAIDGTSREPPIGAKISYASRVIANFVPNFVAMATRVGRGKMQLAAFDGPSPKTPL